MSWGTTKTWHSHNGPGFQNLSSHLFQQWSWLLSQKVTSPICSKVRQLLNEDAEEGALKSDKRTCQAFKR